MSYLVLLYILLENILLLLLLLELTVFVIPVFRAFENGRLLYEMMSEDMTSGRFDRSPGRQRIHKQLAHSPNRIPNVYETGLRECKEFALS